MLQELKKDLSLWINGYSKSPVLFRVQRGLFQLTRQQKLLITLVVIGAGVRLYLLAEKSIWLDEAFSITISQRSLVDMLSLIVRTDTHPPLYYLVLKIWLVFGESETQARLLSTLFSIASIPLIYFVGASLYEDERVGLIAAIILTLSPFQVWYAQETRMYAMLTFFVLASAYFFLRALRYGDWRDWIGYILTTVVALYTDNGAIWYIATITVFFLLSLRRYKERIVYWFLSAVAIGLLYLPWLPFFLSQTRQVTEDFWLPPPSFQTVLETFLDFQSFNFPFIELSLVYMTMVFVWAYIIPRKTWQLHLTSMWFFIPLFISLLFSLRQPIFLSRNLIVASLGYYLLIAGTIGQFHSRKAVLALLLPLVIMNTVSIGYNARYEGKEDWRTVASFLAQETKGKQGGLVVFLPGYAELPFNYYFKPYGISIDTQGYPGDEILLHPKPNEVEDLTALMEGLPYVWLIVRDIETADPDWTLKAWLDTHGYVRQMDLVSDSLTVLSYYRWDKAPIHRSPNRSRIEPKVFLPVISRGLVVQTYVVKPGETLLEIALRFDTTVQTLMDANQLENPLKISEGQELMVPLRDTEGPTSEDGQP
ncbi:MAG TPA: glycosyltransferase family 39 protein [Anaerolineales bacterium]|nr:glycosyltransferase family 39 protein [Anaerolineales bacterium]